MRTRLSVCATLALLAAIGATPRIDAQAAGGTAPVLLSEYLKIHDALASDRVEGVVAAAQRIAATAGETSSRTGGDEKALYAALAGAAGRMEGRDLAVLRDRLGDLTAALKAVLRAIDAEGWLLFRCSMVDEEWIQADEKVRNPYYGPSMLSCGEPVEAGTKR
jgi:hypothetical protein